MNEYFISPRYDMNCVVRFTLLNTYVPGRLHLNDSAYIGDLYFLKEPEDFELNKTRTGFKYKDRDENRYRFSMMIRQASIYRFETDEEALLFQEVME